MKNFIGEDIEIVDATARERIASLGDRFKFATQGQIDGAITRGNNLFLVVAQRWSTKASAVYLIHNYNSTINTQIIYQDSQMRIETNDLGTVNVKYNNSTADVFVGVLELK